MCEEGHEEVIEQLKHLSEQFESYEARLKSVEEMQQHMDKMLSSDSLNTLMKNGLTEVLETVNSLNTLVFGNPRKGELGLAVIINGSKELGVEPLRSTLSRVALTHDRFIWLAGILGITTITGLISFILWLLNRGGVP